MNAVVEFPSLQASIAYQQLEIEHDRNLRTIFSWMKPTPRSCFTPALLADFELSESLLELHRGHVSDCGSPARIDYGYLEIQLPVCSIWAAI